MSRWKISALHLGCSVSVIFVVVILLSLTWYPPDYARAAGGVVLASILAGVDACLGPLLTLIVWDVKKPGLRFDMVVIVLLQLSGLGYGLYSIYWARPVYIVFSIDRFDLVSAASIAPEEWARASQEKFTSPSLIGPQLVAAKIPGTTEERSQVLFSALSGGADLPELPRYYVPYQEMTSEVIKKAKPLDTLLKRGPEIRDILLKYIEKKRWELDRVRFLPLHAREDQTVLIDATTAQIIGILPIDPW